MLLQNWMENLIKKKFKTWPVAPKCFERIYPHPSSAQTQSIKIIFKNTYPAIRNNIDIERTWENFGNVKVWELHKGSDLTAIDDNSQTLTSHNSRTRITTVVCVWVAWQCECR